MNNTDRIRKLNDLFRTTFAPGLGEVNMSSDVERLKPSKQVRVMRRVATATSFDNAEHSRGRVTDCGVDYIWKIDVIDRYDKMRKMAPFFWVDKESWRYLTVMRADK